MNAIRFDDDIVQNRLIVRMRRGEEWNGVDRQRLAVRHVRRRGQRSVRRQTMQLLNRIGTDRSAFDETNGDFAIVTRVMRSKNVFER